MDAGLILHAFYRVESGVDLSAWLQDYQGVGGWVGVGCCMVGFWSCVP